MKRNLKRWVQSASILLAIPLLFCPIQVCDATLVWADDFSDNNYDDWTVTGGNFSATNGMLRSDSNWSKIMHHSSVTEGTWSFDVYVNADEVEESLDCGIYFIAGNYSYGPAPYFGYFENAYSLLLSDDLMMLTSDFSTIEQHRFTDFTGWWNIDITRDSQGQIHVFVNDYFVFTELDTLYSESMYFGFWSREGSMLDNIVVSDSVDVVQQWYDLGPLSGLDYLQLIITILLFILSLAIFVKPSKRLNVKSPNWWHPYVLLLPAVILSFVIAIISGDKVDYLWSISFSFFWFGGVLSHKRERNKLMHEES